MVQVTWFALRKLGGDAPKAHGSSLDATVEQGSVAGGGPNTTPTELAIPGKNNVDGGSAESSRREGAFAGKAAAPVDATALGLAARRPTCLRDVEYAALAASGPRGDVLQTGHVEGEDTAMNMISVPLLPHGSGVQNGNG